MFFTRALFFRRFGYSSLLLLFILIFAQSSLASTIAGFVYDQNRNPVTNVDVELLNENYNVLLRTKTNGVGRYEFGNLGDGRFYVRVLPFRYSLEDQTQEVVVTTLSLLGAGNGNFEQDFFLSYKKGGLGDTTTGVVFVQEIPKEAEEIYKEAEKDFSEKKTTEGMNKLIKAIEIFPTYYAASQRLGIELLLAEQYLEAAKLFIRAAEVNPKSSRAFYYMGFSLNKLGKKYNKGASNALKQAVILAPASWEVAFLAGKIEREEGNYAEAEKHLLKSKKLSEAKNPEIHKELAQLYANDLKQYGKAADELELYMKTSKIDDNKIKEKIADLRNKAKKNS
jgi:tetratricopeptide (TPR) repeat protein